MACAGIEIGLTPARRLGGRDRRPPTAKAVSSGREFADGSLGETALCPFGLQDGAHPKSRRIAGPFEFRTNPFESSAIPVSRNRRKISKQVHPIPCPRHSGLVDEVENKIAQPLSRDRRGELRPTGGSEKSGRSAASVAVTSDDAKHRR
jgi:hypothetical protein